MPLNPTSAQGIVGVSAWKTQVMQRALSIDASLNLLIANDFEVSSAATGYTNTSGTVTYDTGLSGGVVRLRGGVLGFAISGVYNAGGSALVGSPLNESWYSESRAWIKNAPVTSTFYAAIGMQNIASGEFVELGMRALTSTENLVLTITNGAGTTTIDTNVAADLANFHGYGLGRDVVNDKIYAMVDGVPILELDGPFANLTALPAVFYSSLQTTPLGQDCEIWVDNIATVVKSV